MQLGKGISDLDLVSLKFPKPNVLLLDVEGTAGEALTTQGFNISIGSLGTPYQPKFDS